MATFKLRFSMMKCAAISTASLFRELTGERKAPSYQGKATWPRNLFLYNYNTAIRRYLSDLDWVFTACDGSLNFKADIRRSKMATEEEVKEKLANFR